LKKLIFVEEDGVFISQDALEKSGRKPLQLNSDISIGMDPLDIKTLLLQFESKGTLHRTVIPKQEKPRGKGYFGGISYL
jgi:hypothetical protein